MRCGASTVGRYDYVRPHVSEFRKRGLFPRNDSNGEREGAKFSPRCDFAIDADYLVEGGIEQTPPILLRNTKIR